MAKHVAKIEADAANPAVTGKISPMARILRNARKKHAFFRSGAQPESTTSFYFRKATGNLRVQRRSKHGAQPLASQATGDYNKPMLA